MSSSQVMDGTILEQCPDTSLTANQSFTADEKSAFANSSFENSPSLDREKFLRYSARSRDEFWDALSSNYDYLMDDGLIATCREASSDLSLDDEREIPEALPSFTQFIEQFKWLHDLLHNIQVAEEGGSDSSGSKKIEDQEKIAYLCKLFNEQAQRLTKRYPDMRDEVHRHLNRLNNKWKAVELSINPNKVKSPSKDSVFHEISLRMRNLRKWLTDLESKLSPINPDANWTLEILENTYKEREELQSEIEVKGKCISSLLKLCDHLKGNVQFGQKNSLMQWDSEQVRKVAHNLERKWHSLWLESLQNQCILEDLIDSFTTDGDLEKSFSEEPLKKYPRLSSNCKELLLLENELKDKIDFKMEDAFIDDLFDEQVLLKDLSSRRENTLKNDKGVMVGDTGIAELKAECRNGNGKFEIVQDVGCSSETSAHLSNDEKSLDSPEAHSVKNIDHKNFLPSSNVSSRTSIDNKISSLYVTPNKIYLPPDKYPSISLKTLHMLSDDKQFLNSKYGNCKSVPDSFYKVTSVDEEILDSINPSKNEIVPSELLVTEKFPIAADKSKLKDASNKISHLNLECNSDILNTEQNELDKKNFLIKNCFPSESHQSSYSLAKRNKRGNKSSGNKTSQSSGSWKKSDRVQEWLNKCESVDDGTSDDNQDSPEKSVKTDWLNKTADSSCDASGEYTTTESDSEKSNMSDVNNSVTMSQSFTGSIETVIPVVPEENGVVHSDKAGSTDPSTGVKMRKKKRTTRERPWSVTDVRQTLISSVVPHSTSESALDLLCSPQDSRKLGSKKFSAEKKRLSLTDISALSCPSIKSLKLNLNPKVLNCKQSFLSEKLPPRRKKISVCEKGSEKCDVPSCSAAPKENLSIHNAVLSKISTMESKNGKVSLTECCSSETLLVSENEKSETAVNVEDPESVSDVVWDEYQDPPYLSEPYSEPVDEDKVIKLINFGDDYRAMLGSYSDASSVSLKAPPLKAHKPKSKLSCRKGSSQESRDSLISDSNSDSEDLHNVLKTSNHALQFVINSLTENVQKVTAYSAEFAEFFATCKTNLCHLHAIYKELSSGCEFDTLSKEDIQKLKELIQDWESLQEKLVKLSRADNEQKPKNGDLEAATIDVHRSLAALEEKLNLISSTISNAGAPGLSLNQLQNNIEVLQAGFSILQETKESVLSVSARILRLIDEGGGPSIAILRESGKRLYRQWEDVYQFNNSQLTKLQELRANWHEPTENEMNSSSETTVHWQPVQVGDNLPTPLVSTEELFQNTAAEVQVADQHDVLFEIEEKSARASVECVIDDKKDNFSDSVHLLNPPVLNMKNNLGIEEFTEDVEIDNANSKKASCFWRTLRATVPIQFALVVLYCMSCLMEPHCCDNMNNYDFSLSPHLRYFRGPPPV